MQQYSSGLKQEVFPVILPSCFYTEGFLFEEVAEVIYRKHQVILFGLDILKEDMSRDIVLYPRGRQISSSDVGLVIAEDLWAAEEVSKFGRQVSFLCSMQKLSSCRSSNGKFDQIQDSELLEEVKKSRLIQITRSLDTNEADFSISSDHSTGRSSSGGSGSLISSGYRSGHQKYRTLFQPVMIKVSHWIALSLTQIFLLEQRSTYFHLRKR